jgi:bifunctional non-homologous end joining protein LigD
VQDANGVSDFDALWGAMRWRRDSIILYAFDLMHLNGRDLHDMPLIERRKLLKALVGNDDEGRIQFSDEFTGDAAKLFAACAERKLEGIVSKLATSRYRPGRTKTWLKTKCFTESKFVVVGTDRDRKTGALRALLARASEKGLDYAGAAFIALRDDERAEFFGELGRLETPKGLFKSTRLVDVKWYRPKLIVRVKHLAASKTLRHATVRSLAD